MSGLRHEHIIEVKAVINWEGKGKYFMFQWADGGNLRDFYSKIKRPTLDADFIRSIFNQLAGLTSALEALHSYKKDNNDTGSYRHGDLKPENILRFEDGTRVGLLKVSDMGLAKHHVDETGLRGPTTTRYGTPLYEPPEVFLDAQSARSRRYDIWSMGCIMLELLVWLLYGYEELVKFNNSLNEAFSGYGSPYWVVERTHVRVHPSVEKVMEHIAKTLKPAGPTAVGDLLNIVKSMLLVVPLSRDSATFGHAGGSQPTAGCRAHAADLCRAMKSTSMTSMSKDKDKDNYWFPDILKKPLQSPIDSIPIPLLASGKNIPIVDERQEVSEIFKITRSRCHPCRLDGPAEDFKST